MNKKEIIIVLISWIETEGSIGITFNGGYPHPYISIAQKDKKPLEKIKELLNFGEIILAGSNYILRFRNKNDLNNIISLIDSVDEKYWFTSKFIKYKKLKEFIIWKKGRKGRYGKKDINILNDFIKFLAPTSKVKLEKQTYKGIDEEYIKTILMKFKNKEISYKEVANILKIDYTTVYKWYKKLLSTSFTS